MHTGVKLPIFTIHGNHDYPTNNFGSLSVCDLLHVSNYANYFGKYTDLKEINVKPMIIHKDTMKKKIAIYGLGYIKDGFLNSLF
jgi:double-strand break repair protein MRE11